MDRRCGSEMALPLIWRGSLSGQVSSRGQTRNLSCQSNKFRSVGSKCSLENGRLKDKFGGRSPKSSGRLRGVGPTYESLGKDS
jgi:hypothetical protein